MSMTLNAAVLQKYMTSAFVETGTFDGRGAVAAVYAGFKRVYTIEIDHGRAELARGRLLGFPEVVLLEGDSLLYLPLVLRDLDVKATIFLDAHPVGFGDPTKGSTIKFPLVDELKLIAQHSRRKDHSILIDDRNAFKYWNTTDEEVGRLLKAINPAYAIGLESNWSGAQDMIGAMVK